MEKKIIELCEKHGFEFIKHPGHPVVDPERWDYLIYGWVKFSSKNHWQDVSDDVRAEFRHCGFIIDEENVGDWIDDDDLGLFFIAYNEFKVYLQSDIM